MAVQGKIDDGAPISEPEKYPYLGRATGNGMVVLFTAPKTGTCLLPGRTGNNTGTHVAYWDEAQFVRLARPLILVNAP